MPSSPLINEETFGFLSKEVLLLRTFRVLLVPKLGGISIQTPRTYLSNQKVYLQFQNSSLLSFGMEIKVRINAFLWHCICIR